MSHHVILLPGVVLPAELAYADLLATLGDDVQARAKGLELYAADGPPADYGFETEFAGIERVAAEAGFARFHLVGYSGGGAIAAAFTARYPDRVKSLSLLEPAWLGRSGRSASEIALWEEMDRVRELPHEELMARFVRMQLAPGVEPPAPAPGPAPPWMARRPLGIRALTGLFLTSDLDLDALARFDRPVYYALGGRSNPEYFGVMAARLGSIFTDYTLDVFDERHHFDPPHRAEPKRLAGRLVEVWQRALTTAG